MTKDDKNQGSNGEESKDWAIKETIEAKIERHKQQREEDRERISFEWCESIRKAGQRYRETESLESIQDTLNVNHTTAREAVALYLLVFEALPNQTEKSGVIASRKACDTAIKFFRDNMVPEDFVAEDKNGTKEYQERICEFVGSLYRLRDLDSVELTTPPERSTLKTPDEQLSELVRISVNSAMTPLIKSQQRLYNKIQSLSTPQQQLINLVPAIENQLISLKYNFGSLLEPLKEFYDETQVAIIEGVHNFESPEDYNKSEIVVNERAKKVAVRTVEEFLLQIIEEDLEDLFPYLDQLYKALESYRDGEYTLPCYVFTFTLEGVMERLCIEQGFELNEGEDYYNIDTKCKAFAMTYANLPSGYYGVECGEIVPQLENFLKHRNALAHGDTNAVIDENIATVAMLFLMLSLYPTIKLLSDNIEDGK